MEGEDTPIHTSVYPYSRALLHRPVYVALIRCISSTQLVHLGGHPIRRHRASTSSFNYPTPTTTGSCLGPSYLPPIFSLYKHNYSTYTSVQLPTWKCLAMDAPHMKMIDTSCFFLTHWNCNGKYTRHKTRVARLSRWGCLNSRMGVQFIAAFAFVPSHGCSRQHNRSLRFFSFGRGTIKGS